MTRKGFTLIEMVVVMGIIVLITAISVPSLLGSREQAEVNSSAAVVVSDIKQQQLKAMLGDTEGRSDPDFYGVHFEQETYTLFHGSSYSMNDPTNAVIALPDNLQFSSVSFPQSTIVFAKGSGEIVGFTAGADSVLLYNPNNNQSRQITFNQYGVVTGAP